MAFEDFLWFCLCAAVAIGQVTCLLMMSAALCWAVYTVFTGITGRGRAR